MTMQETLTDRFSKKRNVQIVQRMVRDILRKISISHIINPPKFRLNHCSTLMNIHCIVLIYNYYNNPLQFCRYSKHPSLISLWCLKPALIKQVCTMYVHNIMHKVCSAVPVVYIRSTISVADLV